VTFDTVMMVDWSGGNDRGLRPKRDAIWTCLAGDAPRYHRNRQVAERYLTHTLRDHATQGMRTLVGFDICFGYPLGFAKALTGSCDTLALWDWFEAQVQDAPEVNNRFDLAGEINARLPGVGPFWGNGLKRDITDLPRKGRARNGHGLPEHRAADAAMKGAFSPWQLAGAGAVGSQVIMGLPLLSRLRHDLGPSVSVWPFQPVDTPIVLAEVFLSLLGSLPTQGEDIRDASQVRTYANLFAQAPTELMDRMLDVRPNEEAWTLGIGFEGELRGFMPRVSLAP
jgi:hypothetical protein